MKLNPREKALSLINGDSSCGRAVINPTSIATAESCSDLGFAFNESHLDADKMSTLAAYGFEKLGFDSVMPYFSVVQEAAAFGCEIDWGSADTLPTQRSHAFSEPDDFKMPKDFFDKLPIKTVIDSIRMLKKKHPGALIIGKVMGPWTLSYHLYGMENFLMDTITERERALGFLNAFKQVSKTFAEAQFEAGADVITIADHATADLVSPLVYKDLLLPIHRELNNYFSDKTLILHCCGRTLDRMAFFEEAGFRIFHFDSKNDLKTATGTVKIMKLTGCVNNPDILLNGSATDVRKQVNEILEAGIRIVSPECAIPLRVKNSNLAEIANTVRLFRWK
ncbi:MAG TPA: MtaA/CmuA family methyltransferase [Lentisphaeria bacterium]|nr:MAG: hypothetical protein A2X45_07125 [Lentisphaerae bacterium GWF2_50_93]HCE43313.1 MtaA/CmuA family methyltransferase [Lentisphaeria bacterium]